MSRGVRYFPAVRDVWMVSDAGIRISTTAASHPAIIISLQPLVVLHGSSTFRWGPEHVAEPISNSDLVPGTIGKGFTRPTQFDVCSPYAVRNPSDLMTFIGVLNEDAWVRVLAAQRHCWD